MKRVIIVSLLVSMAASCSRREPLGVIDTRTEPPAKTGIVPGAAHIDWPASQRVFVVRDDEPLVLGAQGTDLWAARLDGPVLWTIGSESVVQQVAAGDIGRGHRVYVARGRGRARLLAPLIVEEIDPDSGEKTELWRFTGGRNDVAHLSVSDVDRDGKSDLALAYFESKYQVRARYLTSSGEWQDGEANRMATERAWADIDGDGASDAVVGRMYGDALGEHGDLEVTTAAAKVLALDIDRGVRALTVAQLSADAHPTLYFADGWAAKYAAEAKAQLKRVRFVGGEPRVELLGRSPDEYTFNRLEPVSASGRTGLLAWGNRELSVFWPGSELPWQRIVVGRDTSMLSGALVGSGGAGAGLLIVVPGAVTRVHSLPL